MTSAAQLTGRMDKSRTAGTSIGSRKSGGSSESRDSWAIVRRRTPQELRKIRDKADRKVRKMSVAPNEAFIVEESMLEDLCEVSGEEARDGGNIMLHEEKEELLRRISTNPRTKSVFSSTSAVKRFSTSAVTKGEDYDPIGPATQRSSVISQRSSSISKRPSQLSQGSFQPQGVCNYNVTRARRQSVQSAVQANPGGHSNVHSIATSINMTTEYQALHMARKNETCPCLTAVLALCNIHVTI